MKEKKEYLNLEFNEEKQEWRVIPEKWLLMDKRGWVNVFNRVTLKEAEVFQGFTQMLPCKKLKLNDVLRSKEDFLEAFEKTLEYELIFMDDM